MIDARTAFAAVVGHPVGHSRSPTLHNAALAAAAHNAVYLALDVAPLKFDQAIHGLCVAGARGVNVTVPHKRAAAAVADRRDPLVDLLGVANTLVFEDGSISAYNTDVAGFNAAVRELGVDVTGQSVLVLGAGGAAAAAVFGLSLLGAHVVVANRTYDRAIALAASAGVSAIAWPAAVNAGREAVLVVNATSVGLGSHELALDPSLIAGSSCVGVLDLVYGSGGTPFTRAAAAAGLAALDGTSMLVGQAEAAFPLLFGIECPRGAMSRSLKFS